MGTPAVWSHLRRRSLPRARGVRKGPRSSVGCARVRTCARSLGRRGSRRGITPAGSGRELPDEFVVAACCHHAPALITSFPLGRLVKPMRQRLALTRVCPFLRRT